MPILEEFIEAIRMPNPLIVYHSCPVDKETATAELEPITADYVQSDEGK